MFIQFLRQLLARPSSPSRNRVRVFDYGSLERRELLAAVSYDPFTLTISIGGTSGNDNIEVTESGFDLQIDDLFNVYTYDIRFVNEIQFSGGAGDDIFRNNTSVDSIALGHKGNDTLQGGSGNDYLHGGTGNDVLTGGDGDDRIIGHDGIDQISAGDGDDLVQGGRGSDYISGGAGSDYLNGGQGADTVLGDAGDDIILGYHDDDVLEGGDGNDRLYGQFGDDLIRGDDGNDRLRGGPGRDNLYGGNDDDFARGDQDDDFVWGEAGSDRLYGFTGDNYLSGGAGNDFLYGYDGVDEIDGGDGDDVLRGGGSDDLLYGGAGDDYIRAGAGSDLIYAGSGNDRVLGESGNDQIWGGDGADRIDGNDGDDLLRGGDDIDTLSGGSGNDSLIGGVASRDNLAGGSGADRFLTVTTDQVSDLTSEDARIIFEDATGFWTDLEIEVLDRGFAELVAATGNTLLIKDSLPSGDLTFYKYDSLDGSAAINYLEWTTSQEWDGQQWVTTYEYHREIHVSDWDETSAWYNNFFQSTAIHELAHNWDDSFELAAASSNLANTWDEFLGISGWTDVNPGSNGYTQSDDGQWWYQNSAAFAEDYGRTNPNEDMATIWEAYFHNSDDVNIQSKLDIVQSVLDELATLA